MESAKVKIRKSPADLTTTFVDVGNKKGGKETLKTSYPLIMIRGRLEVETSRSDMCVEFTKKQCAETEKDITIKGKSCDITAEIKEQKDDASEPSTPTCNREDDSTDKTTKQDLRMVDLGYIRCHSLPTGHEQNWPVSANGEVKIFSPVKKGKNLIMLSSCETKRVFHELHVHYEPIENKRYVRPVYIICEGSDGKFQAPSNEDNSIESAVKRISFNARILQTFTGENLNMHGFGRRSFRLEEDDEGIVKVSVFQSKLSIAKALEMTGDELYRFFKDELSKSELFDPLCKFWVFMSCTNYQPPEDREAFDKKKIPMYVKGHTALGGDNLALFGTGCLHTWARNLEELFERFTDDRKIDFHSLFDDSCNRGYYWANYSTTLGAAMHELGHTFNLPHTSSGIMGRGFDDMNCFYTSLNYPIGDSKKELISSPYSCFGAHWHRSSAAILNHCQWIGNRSNNYQNDLDLPIMSFGFDEIGPVGGGSEKDKDNVKFNLKTWLDEEGVEFKGLRIKAGEFINAFQFIGSKRDDPKLEVVSPWYGNENDGERINEIRLNDENEQLTAMDVRAGDWIDAIRLHTTHKSSIWFGGKGGDLYTLKAFDCNSFIDGVFGTAANFVTTLGLSLSRENKDELATQQDNVFFQSPHGVRVIEAQCDNGEVIKHWEYIDDDLITITKDDLLQAGRTETVAVYDGVGGKSSFKLQNFVKKKNNFELGR